MASKDQSSSGFGKGFSFNTRDSGTSFGDGESFSNLTEVGFDDDDWQSSNIKGFSFEDEDPFRDLYKYNSNADTVSGSEISSSRVVSDKIRAASAVYAAQLDRQDRPGISISDALSDVTITSSSSDPILLCNDVGTLRSELIQARRNLEKIQLTRYVPLHPRETVKNIFFGNPFSLEFYKSWTDKLDLLEEAVAIGDGNVLLTVLLFLRHTLSRTKLAEILTTSPEVVNQLAAYLDKRGKLNELADLYASVGRFDDSALVHYRAAIRQSGKDVDSKIWRLKGILNLHFSQSHPDSAYLIEHVHLLERASPVAAIQTQQAGPILNLDEVTVHDLLEFCSHHHFEATENLLQSPLAIKKCHKLTERQFIWPSLRGRAAKSAWKDCKDLVLTKGWLGGNKIKSDVDPLDVSRLLHKFGAPSNVLQCYIELIEPLEEREKFARKVGAHTVVVDVYVVQRDRQALEAFKSRLVPQTEEWHHADNALTVTNTKWKN